LTVASLAKTRHSTPLTTADSGDLRRAGGLAVVHPFGRQRREFEKGRVGVEQPLDALARQQLARGAELGRAALAAAGAGLGLALVQLVHQRLHGGAVGRIGVGMEGDRRLKKVHRASVQT
jgi:hypothetical protein